MGSTRLLLSKTRYISSVPRTELDYGARIYTHIFMSICFIRDVFNKFPDFLYRYLTVVDSWKFSILLLYILWDDWPTFMISGSNEQLHQQLEYTLLKPDCHSWWISKIQSGRVDTLEERYAIKFCFKLGTKCHRNVWNASDCFSTILHESSISFCVAYEIQGRQGVCEG